MFDVGAIQELWTRIIPLYIDTMQRNLNCVQIMLDVAASIVVTASGIPSVN